MTATKWSATITNSGTNPHRVPPRVITLKITVFPPPQMHNLTFALRGRLCSSKVWMHWQTKKNGNCPFLKDTEGPTPTCNMWIWIRSEIKGKMIERHHWDNWQKSSQDDVLAEDIISVKLSWIWSFYWGCLRAGPCLGGQKGGRKRERTQVRWARYHEWP